MPQRGRLLHVPQNPIPKKTVRKCMYKFTQICICENTGQLVYQNQNKQAQTYTISTHLQQTSKNLHKYVHVKIQCSSCTKSDLEENCTQTK